MAPELSWPAQLVGSLADADLTVVPTMIAETGWTAADVLAAVETSRPEPNFGLVSLQVGVNDHYRGSPVEEFVATLDRLLAAAIRLASQQPGRVLVVSIPDWTVTPHAADRDRAAQSAALGEYNRRLRAAAGRVGCAFADVTGSSRRAAEEPLLLADDQLHPSAEMYRRWMETLLPAATRILERRPPGTCGDHGLQVQ